MSPPVAASRCATADAGSSWNHGMAIRSAATAASGVPVQIRGAASEAAGIQLLSLMPLVASALAQYNFRRTPEDPYEPCAPLRSGRCGVGPAVGRDRHGVCAEAREGPERQSRQSP